MSWWLNSLFALTAGLSVVTPTQPASPNSSVVAIVLTNGRLLPFATWSAGKWIELPWPQHYRLDDSSPSVRLGDGGIPSAWFTPVHRLPAEWTVQPINGRARVIRTGMPVPWEIAAFDTIGLMTDYVDPDPAQRSFDFNAGIAVSGRAEALPLRRFDGSSPQWRALVRRHVNAFLKAERTATTRKLEKAEVSLFRVAVDAAGAYEYFEALVWLPPSADAQPPTCPSSVQYHGLIVKENGRERMRWIRGAVLGCGALTEGMEVVGAVRAGGKISLVVEYSGDDWQDFVVVDPDGPEEKIRRGPRPSGRQPEPGRANRQLGTGSWKPEAGSWKPAAVSLRRSASASPAAGRATAASTR